MDEIFHCNECDLNFSNNAAYEKHKHKFCPNDDINQQTMNGHLLNLSSGKSCSRKNLPRISSHGFTNKLQEYSLSSRYETNIDELQRDADKLEKDKEEIMIQLDALSDKNCDATVDRSPQPSIFRSNVKHNFNNGRISLKAKLANLHKSLNLQIPLTNTRYSTDKKKSLEKYEYLLQELRTMQDEYENNGGQDEEVLQYFILLQEEISDAQWKRKEENSDDLLLQLQDQLKLYEAQNNEMKKEIESLKNQQYMVKYNHGPHKCNDYNNYIYETGSRNNTRLQHHVLDQTTYMKRYHEQRLLDMRQETEIYRQQLELERLRQELNSLRGHPDKPVLPYIGSHSGQLAQKSFINTENELYNISQHKQEDAFQPSPYDPGTGFSVFWDFVSIQESIHTCCRLLVTLYKDGDPVSDIKILPIVTYGQINSTNHTLPMIPSNIAMFGVKQVFPRCFPLTLLSVCVVFQTGTGQHENMLQDDGWCKIDLFDRFNRLICGRWKVPIRVLPTKPDLNTSSMNAIPQLGHTELYFRLVNSRDMPSQEGTLLNPQLMCHYKYPPMESPPVFALPQLSLEGLNSVAKTSTLKLKNSCHQPVTKLLPKQSLHKRFIQHPPVVSAQIPRASRGSLKADESHHVQSETVILQDEPLQSFSNLMVQENVGVQVDRIIDLSMQPIQLKVSIYNPDGQVAYAEKNHAEFRTNFVKPTFLKEIHCYSLQQPSLLVLKCSNGKATTEIKTIANCSFTLLQLYPHSILIVEAYEKAEDNLKDDVLKAWSAVFLFQFRKISRAGQKSSHLSRHESPQVLSKETLLSGPVDLILCKPPMVKVKKLIGQMKKNDLSNCTNVCENATISLHLYNDDVPPRNLPMSIPVTQFHETPPVGSWIDCTRDVPNKLFENGDGFDVYIDSGRFFPDSTVAAKVIVGLYDHTTNKRGGAFRLTFESLLNLHTTAYEPVFDTRLEFREFTYSPQSKLVFMVYILDIVTKQVSLFGQSIFPVFVKPNSFDYAGSSADSFCLNRGSMQLRLFQELEDIVNYDERKLKSPVPCSSLLVRVLPAACYQDGVPKRAEDFPEDEWITEGVLVPPTSYKEGHYDSHQCCPTPSEVELLHFFHGRTPVMVKGVMKRIAPESRKTKSEQGLLEWLKGKFKIEDQIPLFELKYLVKYSSLHGLFVCVERAQNVPWNGFTFAAFCISPPSSFYQGLIDDPLMTSSRLNPDSFQRHPQWLNGVKILARRQLHPNLAIIVHLYEVTPKENIFTINSQAWTVLPVCTMGYLSHGFYQLPVFQGAPSLKLLNDIQSQPLIPTIAAMRKKKLIKIIDGTSVFIRVGDPRRVDDIENNRMEVNQMFLPRSNKFLNPVQSKSVRTLIPAGIPVDDYINNVGKAFHDLIGAEFEQHRSARS